MKTVSFVIFAVLLAGCLSIPADEQRRPSRDQMVKVATQEIHRRQLPLPAHHEVVVTEGFNQTEIRPRERIFGVSFKFLYLGVTDTVYVVWVDEHGAVDDVTDNRPVLPLKTGSR